MVTNSTGMGEEESVRYLSCFLQHSWVPFSHTIWGQVSEPFPPQIHPVTPLTAQILATNPLSTTTVSKVLEELSGSASCV